MAVRLTRVVLLCAVMSATLGFRQPLGPGDLLDRILAVVEGQVIMLSDVRPSWNCGSSSVPMRQTPPRWS